MAQSGFVVWATVMAAAAVIIMSAVAILGLVAILGAVAPHVARRMSVSSCFLFGRKGSSQRRCLSRRGAAREGAWWAGWAPGARESRHAKAHAPKPLTDRTRHNFVHITTAPAPAPVVNSAGQPHGPGTAGA